MNLSNFDFFAIKLGYTIMFDESDFLGNKFYLASIGKKREFCLILGCGVFDNE